MKKITMVFGACLLLGGCISGFNDTYVTSRGYVAYNDSHGSNYFPRQRDTHGKKTFVFSPQAMAWGAYDETGNLVRTGPASGGVDVCPEQGGNCRTVTGVFHVNNKGDYNCVSKTYPIGEGGAPMAYCMFFHGGYAIHGSPDVPNVHASHGCIRVRVDAARWLNEEFLDVGSPVVVESY